MAQKHDSHAAAHLPAPPAHTSPQVTPSDKLLSSVVPLPLNSRIAYVTFIPATDGPPYDILELGRRQLVSRNDSLTLLESTLPHVHIDGNSSALHVFVFISLDQSDASLTALKSISLDGLVSSDVSLFDPQTLYPCSYECASQPSPCHLCSDPKRSSVSDPDFSAANLLPRKPLRVFYSHFISALRARIIDDIIKVSKDAASGRSAHRLVDGFLLSSSPISNEWATDWLNGARLRPLVHCQLEVHLSASRLEVYSHLRPTDLLSLDFSLPLAAGTPIILLPFGVPAYYLSAYNGPTSGITSQFEQSLSGCGAGEWNTSILTLHSERQSTFRSGVAKRTSPTYIIAWIAVQNKQGEDKGTAIIWPLQLCLAFAPSSQSAHARHPLPYIPDLPPQLQPSPPPPPPPSAVLTLPHARETNAPVVPTASALSGRPISRRLCVSPTSESVRAFRCLTISRSSKVDSVASEIGLYVESVAKERERERERIRRERENAQSSASPRTVATPSTSTGIPTSTSVTIASNSPAALSPTNVNHAAGETQILTDLVDPPMAPTPSNANPPPPYPSPPSVHGKATTHSGVESGTVVESASVVSKNESVSPPLDPPFDPFGSTDGSWTQPHNDFMNLGEAYDMGFDMNVDDIGTGGGGGTTSTGHVNMDFEDGFTFTEDDFDFFDRPSGATKASRTIVPPIADSAGLQLAGSAPVGFSPSILGDGPFSVAAAFTPGQQQPSPFTVSGTADSFTPRLSELYHMQDVTPASINMTLPSPESTPNSEPSTPHVKLSLEHKKGPTILSNFFEPIPFAQSHRLSDSKYHMGKFALPSPPDEEDRTQPIPCVPSPSQNNHWKYRYNIATDPRIGLVRKLIGVKRKSFDQGSRRTRRPSWLQHDLDSEHPVSDDPNDASDTASDDEDAQVAEPAIPSRAITPPPAYLPLGPTLLHMQFSHPYLLPLSRPLRPPGAAVAPMTIPVPVPTSVPTPVSPAAALGAASEKSKSLEAAGSMIAREVVENSIFADAWLASNTHCSSERQSTVWPADVSTLFEIVRCLPAHESPVELQTLLHHGKCVNCHEGSFIDQFQQDGVGTAPADHTLLQRMDTPMILAGKGESMIQTLPASVRFWEKLGLTPHAGRKDITAFLFFEDNGVDRQPFAEAWLRKLSATYSAHQLGAHVPGSHPLCSVDGIFVLRLDSLRKYLASFATDLSGEQGGLVFYIAIPDSALTLASPLLRQISSAMKRLQKVRSEYPITLQFIPEHHITSHDLVTTDFERLSFSVYQRVPQPVDRTMSRRIFDTGKETRAFFREPAFTLARPPKPTVHFSLGPARTLDVLDRHTFLHIGYRFSSCKKWLLAACVDQRGESYDLGSWLTQDEVETSATLQIWNFVLQAARRTNIEWRLVISKLGFMSPAELDAWIHHLSAVSSLCRDLAPFHVTILSVDQNISWSFPHLSQPGTGPPTPSRLRTPSKDSSKSMYMDVTTATTYAIYPTTRIPLSSPPAYPWADCSFVPDDEGATVGETCPILPARSTILLYVPLKRAGPSCSTLYIHFLHNYKSPGSSLDIPDDATAQEITRNYYELAVLASLQGPFGYPTLPLHLSALESMQDALRQETE